MIVTWIMFPYHIIPECISLFYCNTLNINSLSPCIHIHLVVKYILRYLKAILNIVDLKNPAH